MMCSFKGRIPPLGIQQAKRHSSTPPTGRRLTPISRQSCEKRIQSQLLGGKSMSTRMRKLTRTLCRLVAPGRSDVPLAGLHALSCPLSLSLPPLSPATPNSHATSALTEGRGCVPRERQRTAVDGCIQSMDSLLYRLPSQSALVFARRASQT